VIAAPTAPAPDVDEELLRQLHVREEIELVADVAVRGAVIPGSDRKKLNETIRERIALVRIVVFVLGRARSSLRADSAGKDACVRRP